MSATGLDVFEKTLQSTNIWLDEIMADIGPDRQIAWHTLAVVLRALRDRIPLGLAAHLGSQLPLIVRGTYYDQWSPLAEPLKMRSEEEFLAHIREGMRDIRPVNPRDAAIAVFGVLSRHLPHGQCAKARGALPAEIQALWRLDDDANRSVEELAAAGKDAENAQQARTYEQRPEGQRKRA
jgi:uncharacterized protein (DUF2267 family)